MILSSHQTKTRRKASQSSTTCEPSIIIRDSITSNMRNDMTVNYKEEIKPRIVNKGKRSQVQDNPQYTYQQLQQTLSHRALQSIFFIRKHSRENNTSNKPKNKYIEVHRDQRPSHSSAALAALRSTLRSRT